MANRAKFAHRYSYLWTDFGREMAARYFGDEIADLGVAAQCAYFMSKAALFVMAEEAV